MKEGRNEWMKEGRMNVKIMLKEKKKERTNAEIKM